LGKQKNPKKVLPLGCYILGSCTVFVNKINFTHILNTDILNIFLQKRPHKVSPPFFERLLSLNPTRYHGNTFSSYNKPVIVTKSMAIFILVLNYVLGKGMAAKTELKITTYTILTENNDSIEITV